jgi:ketopantoate hydroxymethyltransferase
LPFRRECRWRTDDNDSVRTEGDQLCRSGTYTVAVTDITGQTDPLQVTMDEMLVVCKALHHGSARVLMSCDLRFGRVQESPEAALSAGQRQRRSLPIGNLMQSLQSKCSA